MTKFEVARRRHERYHTALKSDCAWCCAYLCGVDYNTYIRAVRA